MAAELVETSRLWGRQNAAIDPLWAERLGGDLVKRTYSEPHWSKKRESALAHERVTLYGVPLVADRVVPLGRHQPDVARELFVRHALVQGEWRARHRFFETNRRLLEEAAELEHRARRHDIVVDEETLFDFYDARVPAEVVSGAHFDTWWKQERRDRPDLLTFDPAMLVHEGAGLDEDDFPDAWHEGPLTLPLSYHFEPGHEADGVTIDVPLATLNTVGAAPFTWNVPGLRHELVTALIRSLPKQLRVNFVPAPDVARRFLEAVPPGEEPLLEALSRYLRSLTGVHVPREAWDLDKVPAHLRPTFRVARRPGRGGRRGQGPRGAQAAAAAVVRPRDAAGRRRVGPERDRADHVDLRHDRAVVHADPRRPRGARLPGARRRGQHGRAAGRGLGRRAGGPAPARRTTAAAARGRRPRSPRWSTGSTTPPSSGSPPRRTPTSARSSRTASSRPPGSWSTRRRPVRDEAAFEALVERAPRELRRPVGGGAAPGAARARRVAPGRQGAARPGRDGAAPGDDRPARPARPGWCTTASSARRGRPRCASTRATSRR